MLYINDPCTDPYWNLAAEEYLLKNFTQPVFRLWRNEGSIIIGHYQNAFAEIDVNFVKENGIKVVRRLTGGGAVFHDLGNLNFTFIEERNPNEDTSVMFRRFTAPIIEALQNIGVDAYLEGRNDLLIDGKKFSGNAFYHHAGHAYHHGTLMVDVDKDKLSRYLSPPKAKLEAKGIASVRSRVVNLAELSPGLTCRKMKQLMAVAFETVYGLSAEPITLSEAEMQTVRETAQLYGSWDYLYGSSLPFTFQCEERFGWGHILLQLQAKSGIITAAKVYSDAMDWSLAPALEHALTGCPFRLDRMIQAAAVIADDTARGDICTLLQKQDI